MSSIKRATRVPFDEEVSYLAGGRQYRTRAVNISLSGIFIQTLEVQPLDTELDLSFALPVADLRHPVQVRGKVYRTVLPHSDDPLPPGMGLTFIGLDPRNRSLLSDLVHARARAPFPGGRLTERLDRLFHEQVPTLAWERNLPFVLVAVLLAILLYALLTVL